MTFYLAHYQSDGANFQAKFVLAAVQYLIYDLDNWEVTRCENGREFGYTIFKKKSVNQLNITFCESRNTDCIIVYTWDKWTFNPPTLNDIFKSCVNTGLNDGDTTWMDHTTESFNTLEVKEAAEYILEMMEGFEDSYD